VRLSLFFPVAAGLVVPLLLLAASAHAEPTSWLSVGSGFALQRNGVTQSKDGALAIDGALGVGSPATGPIVVGGVFRAVGYVGLGTDISLSVRFAMQSYCVGDWGLALDLGVGGRFWGNGAYGQYPLHGVLIGGMPFGFQLAVGADGLDISGQSVVAAGGFVALELDFLRLTSMRNGQTTKLWTNPAPANAPPAPTPAIP
jgi:hypothetical protein